MFIENPELRDRKSETDESFLFFFTCYFPGEAEVGKSDPLVW